MPPVAASRVYVASARRPANWDVIRDAVRDIVSRRQLIGFLASAVMRKAGANTLLGNIWWILDPLLQMPLYVLLVGVILRSGAPDYPLFVFAAVLPWKWFTSSLTDATTSVSTRDQLIKQLPFPKLVLPVAAIASGIPQFAFGLIPLVVMMLLFYRDRVTALLLLIPLVAAVQLVLMLAVGILLAAFNVFARDTGRLSGYVLRLWFFLSPALYATDRIDHIAAQHPIVAWVFRLNPFTTLFEAYRDLIYRVRLPDPAGLLVLLVASVALLAITVIVFKRLEPGFAKVL
ncbi:MAG TPA: ABC transporter permease [Methylomirabilota bacterium]|jgi:ABC-type polysaccharide/polyol phosphate export permease|nr:ABC transporter permease [Methylomirabilota bacterium]